MALDLPAIRAVTVSGRTSASLVSALAVAGLGRARQPNRCGADPAILRADLVRHSTSLA